MDAQSSELRRTPLTDRGDAFGDIRAFESDRLTFGFMREIGGQIAADARLGFEYAQALGRARRDASRQLRANRVEVSGSRRGRASRTPIIKLPPRE